MRSFSTEVHKLRVSLWSPGDSCCWFPQTRLKVKNITAEIRAQTLETTLECSSWRDEKLSTVVGLSSWSCGGSSWVCSGNDGDWVHDDDAKNGKKKKQKHSLHLYPSTNKKKERMRQLVRCKPAQCWSSDGHGDDGSARLEAEPKSEITEGERMNQWKLSKDKSVCCRPVFGGCNCGAASLRFCCFLGKRWAAALPTRVFVNVANTQNSSGGDQSSEHRHKPAGSLLDRWEPRG